MAIERNSDVLAAMLTLEIEAIDHVTGQSARFRFTRSPVRIGRSPLCELCLERDAIAPVHAVVHFADGVAGFVDLGSRGGSQAQGLRLDAQRSFALPAAPAEAATIVVGPVALSLRVVPVSDAAASPDRAVDGGATTSERAIFRAPPPADPRAKKALDAAAETRVLSAGRPAAVLDRLRDLSERQADPAERSLLAALVRVSAALLDNTLALRRGADGVGGELGLPRRQHRATPFDDGASSAAVWQHLLGEPAAVAERIDEVTRLFADVLAHDVALLGALRDGTQALVDRLHPAATGVEAGTIGRSVLDRYTEQFERETDDTWSSVLGPDFVASYARAMSGPQPPAGARAMPRDPMTLRATSPHLVVGARHGAPVVLQTAPPARAASAEAAVRGGGEARLVSLSPELGPRAFVLSRPDLLVGRADDCDIQLLHASVSRRHARLALIAGAWRVTDLDSANGILVNKQPRQAAELHDGDVVEFGELAVRFEAAPKR